MHGVADCVGDVEFSCLVASDFSECCPGADVLGGDVFSEDVEDGVAGEFSG